MRCGRSLTFACVSTALILGACQDSGLPKGDASRAVREASVAPKAGSDAPGAEGGAQKTGRQAFAPPFTYRTADTPSASDACAFAERDPADRPVGLIAANRDSNVIFYQKKGGPLWSDIDPGSAIAEIRPDDLIIAARYGKPDLWIKAKKPLATLRTSETELRCI